MDKISKYKQIDEQLKAVFANEGHDRPISDMVKMVTLNSILKCEITYFDWVGFYLVVADDMLEVGPYQGTVGCFFIPFGKGVCGAAAASGETIIVPDVHAFPGHIACDTGTRSEIVVPVFRNGKLIAVLDVDSNQPAAFDAIDQSALESILTQWFSSAE